MKKKKKSNLGWGIALIVELIVIILLVLGIAKNYISRTYNQVQIMEIKEEELGINEDVPEEVREAMKGYTTIALFGVDSRDGSLGAGNRSDAIMIASINNDTKEVKIVSIYRDTLLEIQGDESFTTKINAAYAYGGPQCAVKTINTCLDLNITEYVTVNWEGLTRAIDALGGVTISVEADEINHLNNYVQDQILYNGIISDGVYETGNIKLNGVQATAYSRIRYTDNGDITRTERQREVLLAMVEEAKKADINTINNTIQAVFQSDSISTSITEKEMYELAKSLLSYQIKSTVGFPLLYGYYDSPSKGSLVIAVDLEENVKALHRYLFDIDSDVVSGSVSRITERLNAETGVSSRGKITLPDETNEDGSVNFGFWGSSGGGSGSSEEKIGTPGDPETAAPQPGSTEPGASTEAGSTEQGASTEAGSTEPGASTEGSSAEESENTESSSGEEGSESEGGESEGGESEGGESEEGQGEEESQSFDAEE